MIPELVKNTSYPNYEIILIDNCSNEIIQPWLAENYPSIRYYRITKKNIGFGKANNIGMKKAKGKYLIFLSPDTIPQKNWLDYMVEVAEKDPTVGIVGSVVLPEQKSVFNLKSKDKIVIRPVFSIMGACFLYRKELAEEDSIGKFDRFIYFSYEDIDLSYRVWLSGYRVVANIELVCVSLWR